MSSKGDWSWLRTEAVRRGMTVPQLALCLGVSPQAVNYWERGRNDPDFQNILRLAILFFDGSVERLADRVGLNQVALLQDMTAQAEAMGVELPIGDVRSQTAVLPLYFPVDALISGSDSQARALYRSLAELLKAAGRYREWRDQTLAALRLMRGSRDPFVAQLWLDLAYADLMLGHYPEGVQAAEAARSALRPRQDLALLADTHWLSAESLRIMGDLAEARRHCEEAASLFQRAKVPANQPDLVWVLWNLGRIETASGRYDQALAHLQRTSDMAASAPLADAQALTYWATGYIHEMQGSFSAAREQYHRARQLARRLGDAYWETTVVWRLAELERKTGQIDAARTMVEPGLSAFRLLDNSNMAANLNCTIAACCLYRGEWDVAQALFREAMNVFAADSDFPMIRFAQVGTLTARLAEESQQAAPNFGSLLPEFQAIGAAAEAEYNHFVQLQERLAYAEALRLAQFCDAAQDQFAAVARVSAASGHRVEHAHALLGIAATKQSLHQADRETCIKALRMYQEAGVLPGQVQALVILALIEVLQGGPPEAYVNEAAAIARRATMKADFDWIKGLPPGQPDTRPVVLMFL